MKQKKFTLKSCLALVLVLCMMLSVMPVAMATGEGDLYGYYKDGKFDVDAMKADLYNWVSEYGVDYLAAAYETVTADETFIAVMDKLGNGGEKLVEWHGLLAAGLQNDTLEDACATVVDDVIATYENNEELLDTHVEMLKAALVEKDAYVAEITAFLEGLTIEELVAAYQYVKENNTEFAPLFEKLENGAAKVERWYGILAVAAAEAAEKEDPAIFDAAAKQVAQEIATVYNNNEYIVLAILDMIKEAYDFVAPYVGEAVEMLADLIAVHGSAAIEAIIRYIEANYADELEELLNYLYELLAQTDAAIKAAAEQIAAELYAHIMEMGAMIDAEIIKCVNWCKALYAQAVSLDYCICCEDAYLALGGDTLADGGYYEAFDEYLTSLVDFEVANSKNAAKAGLNSTEIMDYLAANQAAIADATIISWQLDAASFVKAALDEELVADWSKYLPEIDVYVEPEVIELAKTVLAEAEAKLAAEIDLETVATVYEMAYPMLERVAYAVVAYAVDSIKGIEYMTAVNPDAKIVLLGMYNPIRGLKVAAEGETINVGDFFEYVIDATNLYYLACALYYPNVIVVDASDAETTGAYTTLDVNDFDFNAILAIYKGEGMFATEAGQEYIAEQLIAAINFCEHGCPSLNFPDLDTNEWYHMYVDYALRKGLMIGYEDGTFRPNVATNRAQVVTMLWRLEGSPAPAAASDFTDVKAGEWYADPIAWAAEQGIVNGFTDGTYGPLKAVTREQLTTILYRYAESKGYDVSASASLDLFEDAANVQAWAKDAVQWAVAVEVVEGNLEADGTLIFVPGGNAKRCQVAAMFMRLIEDVLA